MTHDLAKGVRWDLTDLYKSPTDPAIASDLKKAETRAKAFEKRYKPSLQKLSGGKKASINLPAMLRDYKEIVTRLTRPMVYAHLRFAENTGDAPRGAFLQKTRTQLTHIQSHILFWEIHWARLDASTAARLMKNPQVKPDLHYLQNIRKYASHTLGEAEEKVLSLKSNTSDHAFARLFDEVLNNIPFYVEREGLKNKMTEGEVLALLHAPQRDTRCRASASLAQGLAENTRLITYIFNMILADHRLHLSLRHYTHPSDPRNLANETDLKTLTALVGNVKKAYPMVSRYYALKRRLLGLSEMYDYDRYAPLEAQEDRIDFARCRRIVTEGYRAFSPDAASIVERFFRDRWIDAEVRPGKQGGGFCSDTIPSLHPYILVNYTGSMRDVMTVAHELGHGIHQYLARKAGILESSAPLTMAETASVFGEMLIFEKVLGDESDPAKRLALICGKIDDNFATVFRQIVLTDFELMAHGEGLREGELSSERLSDIWIEANSQMYGKSVILTPDYRHGWKYIPHFIHTPFYCYAYSFAQLFVLSLFQKYKEDRKGFVPKYFRMLELGGSQKPEEIARIAGIDLKDPKFWKLGLGLLEELVTEAETLAEKVGSASC